jgi:regulator of protease activity HflC (stomatin/prohibitin superfamily)
MKLNTVLSILVLAVVGLASSGCATRISAGTVGIKVDLAGSSRGVENYPIRTGWVFYGPWGTQVFEYPTYVQTVKWTRSQTEGSTNDDSITFTSGSLSVNADVSLSYQLDPAKVPQFYVKFRSDNLDSFTDGFLRNVARDAFNNVGGKYTIEEIMGNNAGFLKDVNDLVSAQVKPLGVDIQQFGFIGAPRPPQNVINAINNAQQAKYRAQQSQNELVQTTAEAAKDVAKAEGYAKSQIAIANGEAESNRVRAASLSPQIIEWQKLAVTDRWISRWNGRTPDVTVGGNGNTPGLILNVPAPER